MKKALVIGGSGGIGTEIVKLLKKESFKIYSTYFTKKEEVEDIEQHYLNLAEEESVNQLFAKILSNNKLDVVIFSATLLPKHKPLLTMEWSDFQEHIDVQTKGLFLVFKNLKEQIKCGHKIKFIIISTEYCIGAPPSGLADYITGKYSLIGLAKSMAVELAKYNCTVNLISPGMVSTKLLSNVPPKLIEITAEKNPLKKIATPQDVANVVLFLAKEGSDYLNGANITVNGGGTML